MTAHRLTSKPSPGYSATHTASRPWTVRRPALPTVPAVPTPRPKAILSRRFEIMWANGTDIEEQSFTAPALPIFEEAFSAFTHGVLIQTENGPVAVEDLMPGALLETADGGLAPLLWKGSITLVPGAPSLSDTPDKLFRVTVDSLGLGRPTQDQTFGPHARRLNTSARVRAALGTDGALVPVRELADQGAAIAVNPVSPTRVYHLATDRHAVVMASGLPVETYHPGPDAVLSMSEEMMEIFMGFFPYLDSIRDFGRLAAPRVSDEDMLA